MVMTKSVRRGYVPEDEKEFSSQSLPVLKRAQEEVCWLINRGYAIKKTVEFVGNTYLLSERQRTAIKRACATDEELKIRHSKLITGDISKATVNIDGLNLIITMEVALSNSTLLRCMDSTVRDLAGLRGTYRLIDKTDTALYYMGKWLASSKIAQAVFYIDSPVSNTGRLKQRIYEIAEENSWPFKVEVNLVPNADVVLSSMDNVISSDGIILNNCRSWINAAAKIKDTYIEDATCVDMTLNS